MDRLWPHQLRELYYVKDFPTSLVQANRLQLNFSRHLFLFCLAFIDLRLFQTRLALCFGGDPLKCCRQPNPSIGNHGRRPSLARNFCRPLHPIFARKLREIAAAFSVTIPLRASKFVPGWGGIHRASQRASESAGEAKGLPQRGASRTARNSRFGASLDAGSGGGRGWNPAFVPHCWELSCGSGQGKPESPTPASRRSLMISSVVCLFFFILGRSCSQNQTFAMAQILAVNSTEPGAVHPRKGKIFRTSEQREKPGALFRPPPSFTRRRRPA